VIIGATTGVIAGAVAGGTGLAIGHALGLSGRQQERETALAELGEAKRVNRELTESLVSMTDLLVKHGIPREK